MVVLGVGMFSERGGTPVRKHLPLWGWCTVAADLPPAAVILDLSGPLRGLGLTGLLPLLKRRFPRTQCQGNSSTLKPVLPRSSVQGGLMWSERKHGLSTEQVPVSAYVGSSNKLKDLQGYLAHKKQPPPLGTLYGPRRLLL